MSLSPREVQPAKPGAVTAKPKRRWYQFSLRLALLVMTLVAVTAVLIRRGPENQRIAVRIALSSGGHVDYASVGNREFWSVRQLRAWLPRDYFDSVVEIDLSESLVQETDLSHFARLTELKKIYLNPNEISIEAANELRMAMPNCTVFYRVAQYPPKP